MSNEKHMSQQAKDERAYNLLMDIIQLAKAEKSYKHLLKPLELALAESPSARAMAMSSYRLSGVQ